MAKRKNQNQSKPQSEQAHTLPEGGSPPAGLAVLDDKSFVPVDLGAIPPAPVEPVVSEVPPPPVPEIPSVPVVERPALKRMEKSQVDLAREEEQRVKDAKFPTGQVTREDRIRDLEHRIKQAHHVYINRGRRIFVNELLRNGSAPVRPVLLPPGMRPQILDEVVGELAKCGIIAGHQNNVWQLNNRAAAHRWIAQNPEVADIDFDIAPLYYELAGL